MSSYVQFLSYLYVHCVHPDGHLSIHPSTYLPIRYRIYSICERKEYFAHCSNVSVTHWILSSSREDFSLFLNCWDEDIGKSRKSLITHEDGDNSKLASVYVKFDLLQVQTFPFSVFCILNLKPVEFVRTTSRLWILTFVLPVFVKLAKDLFLANILDKLLERTLWTFIFPCYIFIFFPSKTFVLQFLTTF